MLCCCLLVKRVQIQIVFIVQQKKKSLWSICTQILGGDPPAQKVPFFIEVKDGKVISITEEFIYTQ